MTTNAIVRHAKSDYREVCNFLTQEYEYLDFARTESDTSIKSILAILLDVLKDAPYVISKLQRIRQADVLFCVGYVTLFIRLLVWIGVIRCRRLYWFSFFLHSPKWYPIVRILLTIGRTDYETFVVFSQYEQKLYQDTLGLPAHKLTYFPYGHWDTYTSEERHGCQWDSQNAFYFSGGASNRDYASLIEVFRYLRQRLVIVCSSIKNKDILDADLPPNVTVYTDLSSTDFDRFVCAARACILPLKHNTGASGQSVLLRYMGLQKAIIASDTEIVKEYIQDGVSAVLLSDISVELPEIISRFEADMDLRIRLGKAARERYQRHFSRETMVQALEEMLAR